MASYKVSWKKPKKARVHHRSRKMNQRHWILLLSEDASPKKIQKTQRKRRRKDDSAVQNSNTYITKIYGCSVDLAQFDENSPLYSMCRSWIQNKPLQSSERNHGVAEIDKKKNTNDSADDDDTKGIFFLPAPVAPPKDDAGNVKDLRIPSPVPQPSEKFFMASDDSEVVPVNVLLAGHQTRWKNVRQKWKEAAMANEERYKESAAILLKAMSNDQDAPSQWESAPA
ncbi:protein lin-37 homolog isoform X3 [Dermacentor albipictus]|uniref:protein lin-37 homolog isoform X3 n=1 Tax=Dermacentor albipictus TaxID=60249 RepID=UPI0031FD1606